MTDPNDTISLGLIRSQGILAPGNDQGRRHLLLRQLDRATSPSLLALAREPHDIHVTYASPARVACSDGHAYWLKARAQRGLAVELVAGRLLHILNAGPEARVVEVPAVVFWDDPRLGRFSGLVVGSSHLPDTLSTGEIAALLGSGHFTADAIDAASRARVVAAQTWMNVDDAQVRVGSLDGRVHSVDHGIALDARLRGRPSNVVVAAIPGVSDNIGRDWSVMKDAVAAIEAVTEAEILGAVAGIPDAPGWQASFERRLAIASWLIKRQPFMGEVMREWCGVLS